MPMHTQHAMNIIMLAMVMASVDQSYFGAPNCANSVNRQNYFSMLASSTIIGRWPETINLPGTQFICKLC